MSELKNNEREDSIKQITENVNSVYPKMDLKSLGNTIKSTNMGRSSHNSSFSNNDAVQEEDITEEKEVDEMHTSKSKFKHVNILTDSDEFNSQIETILRPKSANGDQSGTAANNRVGNQDSILEGCDEEEEGKEQVSKFGAATQLIEESLRVDKGEFDCSTPKQRKQQSLKKINPSGSYQHCKKAEEAIEEDPKEADVVPDNILVIPRISSHKEIKIIVDEVETQEKQRTLFMESSMPIEEEPREEEGVEENKQVRVAKQERDNEKNYIKKIAKGDRLTGAEVLRDLVEELPQGVLKISESQRISEDVGADGNYEDEDDEEEEGKI